MTSELDLAFGFVIAGLAGLNFPLSLFFAVQTNDFSYIVLADICLFYFLLAPFEFSKVFNFREWSIFSREKSSFLSLMLWFLSNKEKVN